MREYDSLWQPLQVGPVTAQEPSGGDPHALAYGRDNLMTQQSVDHYEERAKGGAGLILTEAQIVHPSSRGTMLRTLQSWPTEEQCLRPVDEPGGHRHGATVFALR